MNGHPEKRLDSHGRPRWRAKLYVDAGSGGPRWEAVGTYSTRTEALDAIDARKDQIRGGAQAGARLTVAALLRRWLRDSARSRVRPSTYARYQHDAERVSESPLGDLLAAKVIGADIDAYLAELAAGGRQDKRAGGLSAKSRANLRTTLGSAFIWARRSGLLAHNPVADTEPIRAPEPRRAALSIAQVAEVLAATHGARLEAAVILAAFCGLRRGEALAVRWCDVTPAGVSVTRQLILDREAKRSIFTEPKSAAGVAVVPLPSEASAMLEDLKRRRMNAATLAGLRFDPEGLCTCRCDGSPLPPDQAGGQLAETCARRHLPGVHFHLLRHAYGSELVVRQGVDAKTAQGMMRHADVATTLRSYVHSDVAAQVAAAARLSEAWAAAKSAARSHLDTTDATVSDLSAQRRKRRPA